MQLPDFYTQARSSNSDPKENPRDPQRPKKIPAPRKPLCRMVLEVIDIHYREKISHYEEQTNHCRE